MSTQRIVVIGGSAGGIEALLILAAALAASFPAPVCVVIHTSPHTTPGRLSALISRAGVVDASDARDGESLTPGHVYVAPAGHHLLVNRGAVRLTRGPKENHVRPAIDPLFRSAAEAYGTATVGVVLTGGLDDGTAGLWAIKEAGGLAIVQDPDDALFPSMPQSAAKHVRVDHVVALQEIAPLLTRIVNGP